MERARRGSAPGEARVRRDVKGARRGSTGLGEACSQEGAHKSGQERTRQEKKRNKRRSAHMRETRQEGRQTST